MVVQRYGADYVMSLRSTFNYILVLIDHLSFKVLLKILGKINKSGGSMAKWFTGQHGQVVNLEVPGTSTLPLARFVSRSPRVQILRHTL